MRTPASINAVQCQMVIDILNELANKAGAEAQAEYAKGALIRTETNLIKKDCYAYAAGLLVQERAKNEKPLTSREQDAANGGEHDTYEHEHPVTRRERLAEQVEELKTHGEC